MTNTLIIGGVILDVVIVGVICYFIGKSNGYDKGAEIEAAKNEVAKRIIVANFDKQLQNARTESFNRGKLEGKNEGIIEGAKTPRDAKGHYQARKSKN